MSPSVNLPAGTKPFNGYKKLNSVLIPISLGPAKGINWLDKFLYGRLRFEAGNSDRCQVCFRGLAEELGLSSDSVSRSFERLEKVKLVYRKQLQYTSLIVFLESPLLDGSTPKSGRSGSAELPTLSGTSGSAKLPGLKDYQEVSGSAKLRFQGPQNCGSGSAELRTLYKEFLGANRNKEEHSSSTDAPELSPEPSDKIAAAAPHFSDDQKPDESEPLSPEDLRPIAAASSAAVKGPALSPGSPLVKQIWSLAQQHGCTSVEALIGFMGSRGRTNWKSHGIWLKVIPAEFPEYQVEEAAKPAPPVICEACDNTGIVGHRRGMPSWGLTHEDATPPYCSCEIGLTALAWITPVYSLGQHCRACHSTLKWTTQAHAVQGPQCAFCVPPKPSPIPTAIREKLEKLQALSRSDNEHEASLATEHITRILNGAAAQSETTLDIAARMGAAGPVPKCKACDQTGLLKANWGTLEASAKFCGCEWGRILRDGNTPEYPEELAREEREWTRRCEEFDKAVNAK